MRAVLSAIVMTSAFVLACSGSPGMDESQTGDQMPAGEVSTSAQWSEVAQDELSESQLVQHATAMAAKDEMMGSLLSELEAALDEGGAERAIKVCNEQALLIASHVSATHTVKIGRTSHRLRTPLNRPPEWAKGLVDRRVEEPMILAGPEGELAAFLPIRVKPECQMCHGTAEQITEEVAAAIARDYPDDQAVGFQPGDIRGWLWVEVPPLETGEAEPTA